jgi:hypothetical protein
VQSILLVMLLASITLNSPPVVRTNSLVSPLPVTTRSLHLLPSWFVTDSTKWKPLIPPLVESTARRYLVHALVPRSCEFSIHGSLKSSADAVLTCALDRIEFHLLPIWDAHPKLLLSRRRICSSQDHWQIPGAGSEDSYCHPLCMPQLYDLPDIKCPSCLYLCGPISF